MPINPPSAASPICSYPPSARPPRSSPTPILALIGPTASGKSWLAQSLAEEFGGVILSLDSLAVYKEISIASAKPSPDQRGGVAYFGLDLVSVAEHFNVGLFAAEYERAAAAGRPLIIVGGSGFYLKMLIDGLSEDPLATTTTRPALGLAGRIGGYSNGYSNEKIYEMARRLDPAFRVEKNDSYRLAKWQRIYEATGGIPSQVLAASRRGGVLAGVKIFELDLPREELKKRISARTAGMMRAGLIEEARELFTRFDPPPRALGCIGLRECGDFLAGKITRAELESLINTHTAQLAKRQRTFNKKFQASPLAPATALAQLRGWLGENLF